jgi:hypothetical protein
MRFFGRATKSLFAVRFFAMHFFVVRPK